MIEVILTDREKHYLDIKRAREQQIKKRKFSKKRLSHFRNSKLLKIYNDLNIAHSDVLFEIPFKCHFSLYLYLFLKNKIQYQEHDFLPEGFKLAKPTDVNFFYITKMAEISRNTVRKAYYELVEFGLLMETPEVLPKHLSTKSVLVFNDFNILSYDYDCKKVIFTTEIKHNYSEDF